MLLYGIILISKVSIFNLRCIFLQSLPIIDKEVSQIQINIHPNKKIVCIWLTKAESESTAIQKRIQPLFKQYQAQKYLVIVFKSGYQDLREATYDLLRYNRKLFAEQEIQAEKLKSPF